MEVVMRYGTFIAFIAALSGLLFGLDTGVISGALPLITKNLQISYSYEVGLVISILLLGAICGTILVRPISIRYGRRIVIMSSAFLFMVCSFFSAMADSLWVLIGIRFFLGIALGMASYITPIYLAEVASKQNRGAIISMYQLMITIGLFFSFVLDKIFAAMNSWHWMLGVVAIPAFVMLLLSFYLPRSPRWLMLSAREDEAKGTLERLLPAEEVGAAFNDIKEASKYTDDSASKPKIAHRIGSLVMLGIGLQLIQQWTGINAVLYYAPTIFQEVGFSSLHAQMWCAVLIGLVNVLTTVIAIRYLDKIGRKPILYFGMTIMVFALFTMASVMHMPAPHTIWQNKLAVVATMFYIFGFAISLGPVVWILCAEIFPLAYRDFGVMMTTVANWTFNFLLAQSFPMLLAHVSMSSIFFIFGLVAIGGLFLVKNFVPETKGVTLEEMESNLLANKSLRSLGQ
jgi:MFS transporter, SP family, galactose:H+ symporter